MTTILRLGAAVVLGAGWWLFHLTHHYASAAAFVVALIISLLAELALEPS